MRECFQMGLSLGKQSKFQQKQSQFGCKKSQVPVDHRVVPPLKKYNSQPDCSTYDKLAPMTKSKIKYINKNSLAKICAKSKFTKQRTVEHVQSSQDTKDKEVSLTPTPAQPQDIQMTEQVSSSLAQAWTLDASQTGAVSELSKAESQDKPGSISKEQIKERLVWSEPRQAEAKFSGYKRPYKTYN